MIAGCWDAPLMLRDSAKVICIIKLHVPISFEYKFHDNKRVVNIPLWQIEHGSPDWKPTIITTKPLFLDSLSILMCIYSQLQVLKWPWIHFTSPRLLQETVFFSNSATITCRSKCPQQNKNQSPVAWKPSFTTCLQKVWGEAYHSLCHLWFTPTQHPHFLQ